MEQRQSLREIAGLAKRRILKSKSKVRVPETIGILKPSNAYNPIANLETIRNDPQLKKSSMRKEYVKKVLDNFKLMQDAQVQNFADLEAKKTVVDTNESVPVRRTQRDRDQGTHSNTNIIERTIKETNQKLKAFQDLLDEIDPTNQTREALLNEDTMLLKRVKINEPPLAKQEMQQIQQQSKQSSKSRMAELDKQLQLAGTQMEDVQSEQEEVQPAVEDDIPEYVDDEEEEKDNEKVITMISQGDEKFVEPISGNNTIFPLNVYDTFQDGDEKFYNRIDVMDNTIEEEIKDEQQDNQIQLNRYIKPTWQAIGLQADLVGAPQYRKFMNLYANNPRYLDQFFADGYFQHSDKTVDVDNGVLMQTTPIGYLRSVNLVARSPLKKIDNDTYTLADFDKYWESTNFFTDLLGSMAVQQKQQPKREEFRGQDLIARMPASLREEISRFEDSPQYKKIRDKQSKEAFLVDVGSAVIGKHMINLMQNIHNQGNFFYSLLTYDRKPTYDKVRVDKESTITPSELPPYEQAGRPYYNYSPFTSPIGKQMFSQTVDYLSRWSKQFRDKTSVFIPISNRLSTDMSSNDGKSFGNLLLDDYLKENSVVIGVDNNDIDGYAKMLFNVNKNNVPWKQNLLSKFFDKKEMTGQIENLTGNIELDNRQSLFGVMKQLLGRKSKFANETQFRYWNQYDTSKYTMDDSMANIDGSIIKIRNIPRQMEDEINEISQTLKKDYGITLQKIQDIASQRRQLTNEQAYAPVSRDQVEKVKKSIFGLEEAKNPIGQAEQKPKKKIVPTMIQSTENDLTEYGYMCDICGNQIVSSYNFIQLQCNNNKRVHKDCYRNSIRQNNGICYNCKQQIDVDTLDHVAVVQKKKEEDKQPDELMQVQDVELYTQDKQYIKNAFSSYQKFFPDVVRMIAENDLNILKTQQPDNFEKDIEKLMTPYKANPFEKVQPGQPYKMKQRTREQAEKKLLDDWYLDLMRVTMLDERKDQPGISNTIKSSKAKDQEMIEQTNSAVSKVYLSLIDKLSQIKDGAMTYSDAVKTIGQSRGVKEAIDPELEKRLQIAGKQADRQEANDIKKYYESKNQTDIEKALSLNKNAYSEINAELPETKTLLQKILNQNTNISDLSSFVSQQQYVKIISDLPKRFAIESVAKTLDPVRYLTPEEKETKARFNRQLSTLKRKEDKNQIAQQEQIQLPPPPSQPTNVFNLNSNNIKDTNQVMYEEEKKDDGNTLTYQAALQEIENTMIADNIERGELINTFDEPNSSRQLIEQQMAEIDQQYQQMEQQQVEQIQKQELKSYIQYASKPTITEEDTMNFYRDNGQQINAIWNKLNVQIDPSKETYGKLLKETALSNQLYTEIGQQIQTQLDQNKFQTDASRDSFLKVQGDLKALIESAIHNKDDYSQLHKLVQEQMTYLNKSGVMQTQLKTQMDNQLKSLSKIKGHYSKFEKKQTTLDTQLETLESKELKLQERIQKTSVKTEQYQKNYRDVEEKLKEIKTQKEFMSQQMAIQKQNDKDMTDLMGELTSNTEQYKRLKKQVKNANQRLDNTKEINAATIMKLSALEQQQIEYDVQTKMRVEEFENAKNFLETLRGKEFLKKDVEEILALMDQVKVASQKDPGQRQVSEPLMQIRIKTGVLKNQIQRYVQQEDEAAQIAKKTATKAMHDLIDMEAANKNKQQLITMANNNLDKLQLTQYRVDDTMGITDILDKYLQAQTESTFKIQMQQHGVTLLKGQTDRIYTEFRKKIQSDGDYLAAIKHFIKQAERLNIDAGKAKEFDNIKQYAVALGQKQRGTITNNEQEQMSNMIDNYSTDLKEVMADQYVNDQAKRKVATTINELTNKLDTINLDHMIIKANFENAVKDLTDATNGNVVLQISGNQLLNQNQLQIVREALRNDLNNAKKAEVTFKRLNQDLVDIMKEVKEATVKKDAADYDQERIFRLVQNNLLKTTYENKPSKQQIQAISDIQDLKQEYSKILDSSDIAKRERKLIEKESDLLEIESRQLERDLAEIKQLRKDLKNKQLRKNLNSEDYIFLNKKLAEDQQKYLQYQASIQNIRDGNYEQLDKQFNMEQDGVSIKKVLDASRSLDQYIEKNKDLMPTNFYKELLNHGEYKSVDEIVQEFLHNSQAPLKITAEPLQLVAKNLINAGRTALEQLYMSVYKLAASHPSTKILNNEDEQVTKTITENRANAMNAVNSVKALSDELRRTMLTDIQIKREIRKTAGTQNVTLSNSVQSNTDPSSIYNDMYMLQQDARNMLNSVKADPRTVLTKITAFQNSANGITQKIAAKINKIVEPGEKLKAMQEIETYTGQIVEFIIRDPRLADVINNDDGSDANIPEIQSKFNLNHVLSKIMNHQINKFVASGGSAFKLQPAEESEIRTAVRSLQAGGIITQEMNESVAKSFMTFLGHNMETLKDDFLKVCGNILGSRLSPHLAKINGERLINIIQEPSQAQKFIVDNVDPVYMKGSYTDELKLTYKKFRNFYEQVTQDFMEKSSERAYDQLEVNPIQNIEELKQESQGRLQKRLQTSDRIYSAPGRFLSIPNQNKHKFINTSMGQLYTLTKIQEDVSSLPKQDLKLKQQEVYKERSQLQDMLKNIYKLNFNQDDVQELTQTLKMFLPYMIHDVLNADPDMGPIFNTYPTDFKNQAFHELKDHRLKTMIALEAQTKHTKILGVLLAPYLAQREQGIPLRKEQIINLTAMHNFYNQVYEHLETVKDNMETVQKLYKELQPDVDQDSQQALMSLLAHMDTYIDKGQLFQDKKNINLYIKEFMQETMKLQELEIQNNIDILSDVERMIDARQFDKNLNKYDKQELLKEQVDRNAEVVQNAIADKLNSVGLRSFMQVDQPAQQMQRRIVGGIMPQVQSSQPRLGFGMQQQQQIQPQQQYQQQQMEAPQQQQPQQQQQQQESTNNKQSSGSSKNGQLSSNAKEEAQDELNKEDLAFLLSVRYDNEKDQLVIKDAKTNQERPLTKEEKRRFIKIIIYLILALYTHHIKKLSKKKEQEAAKKLEEKQKKDDGALFTILNRVAEEITKREDKNKDEQ